MTDDRKVHPMRRRRRKRGKRGGVKHRAPSQSLALEPTPATITALRGRLSLLAKASHG